MGFAEEEAFAPISLHDIEFCQVSAEGEISNLATLTTR